MKKGSRKGFVLNDYKLLKSDEEINVARYSFERVKLFNDRYLVSPWNTSVVVLPLVAKSISPRSNRLLTSIHVDAHEDSCMRYAFASSEYVIISSYQPILLI